MMEGAMEPRHEQQTRSAPSPNQTPASRGLVTSLELPEAGKPAAGLGEGWGGGSCGVAPTMPHSTIPTPNPSPQGGGERTEFVALLHIE
jgi:hypothetical protein